MGTNELIERLASGTRPVLPSDGLRRLCLGLAGGGLAILLLIAVVTGDPFRGARLLDVASVGLKLAFGAAVFLISSALLYRSGFPARDHSRGLGWLAVPATLVALLASFAIARAPASERVLLIFEQQSLFCPASVFLLSVPIFAAIVWAFRQLAPLRLARTGALAGLTAGGLAAAIYELYCPIGGPVHMVWYALGIAAAGLFGRIVGPRLLRW